MEVNYRFAGLEFTVQCSEDMDYTNERYLTPFREEKVEAPHIFQFARVPELTAPEYPLITRQPSYMVYGDAETQVRYIGTDKDPHLRVSHRGKSHQVQMLERSYSGGVTASTVLNALALEHLIARNEGFVFHCSYIERDGEAILFTAPSGTGKSTQADLWNTLRGTPIINGDRAVIRVENGRLLACGIPFSGSSTYCENRTLPLKTIVYLSQAPETTIRKLRGYEAFSKLWEGVSVNTWDKEDMEAVSRTVQQTAANVPVYHLACTPDESAVKALEGVL